MKALPVAHPQAAAPDVGSEKLHVSIAGDAPQVFGTRTGELEAWRDWFQAQGVQTVAVEAPGVHWLHRCAVREAAGLVVVVVNGRPGQKRRPASEPRNIKFHDASRDLGGGRGATQIPGRSVSQVLQLLREVGTDRRR